MGQSVSSCFCGSPNQFNLPNEVIKDIYVSGLTEGVCWWENKTDIPVGMGYLNLVLISAAPKKRGSICLSDAFACYQCTLDVINIGAEDLTLIVMMKAMMVPVFPSMIAN